MKRLIAELRRRNVLRAAILYIGAVWALAQGISQLGPSISAPEWSTRWFLVAACIGFPFWIAFAWFYEFTPEGLKRESEVEPHASIARHTGRKLDMAIIVVLAVAVVLLLADRFVAHKSVADVSDQSIAVLPFLDMSEAQDQGYFSDGVAEDILNLLTKMRPLHVAARTSSFSFKGKDVPLAEMARALHVANMLEGSVRKSGDEVRITAQLVRVSDGFQIWSQHWDRKLDDVFKIQDEIATAVASELRVRLVGKEAEARPIDPKVYPLILQAEALVRQGSKTDYEQAVALFDQALSIVPDEPRAWNGLARVYLDQVILGEAAANERAPAIREAAQSALRNDPGNVAALSMLGRLAADIDHDLPTAASYYAQALEREPGNLYAIGQASVLMLNIGRVDEALELNRYILAHDPANATEYWNLGFSLYFARQWDAAIDAFHSAGRLSSELSALHFEVGCVLLLGKGDAEGALHQFDTDPDEQQRIAGRPFALFALGRREEADAALRTLLDKGQNQPETIATLYAYRGDKDSAFEWLDKAASAHDPAVSTVRTEILLDPLHDDPRWLPFLRKIGYAPEQLAKIDFKVVLPESR